MSQSFVSVLAYALIPSIGILAGSVISVAAAPAARMISAFQHFAAGVVFAAVAVELLPQLEGLASPISMVIGFCLGVAAMFAAGVKGGMVLLVGLTLETVSLGLSSAPALVRSGVSDSRALFWMGASGVVVLLGAAVGYTIVGLSGSLLAGILGFGVASLLYLVTEELLAEAHEVPDTPLVTSTFFAGFLLPLVMAAIE